MSPASPLVVLEKPGEEAIRLAAQLLEKAGLRVVRTFDLLEARLSHSDCPCPHHGTEACDCQMIVLLIYKEEYPPVSMIVHSFRETTWFYLVDTPGQPLDRSLENLVRETLPHPVPGLIENRE